MNVIEKINNFSEFDSLAITKAPEDLTKLDKFYNVSLYGFQYRGIGRLFREGSTISRYFSHQHNISLAPVQYIDTKSTKHTNIKKVFDFTLGVLFSSALESLYFLARAVYHLGIGIISVIKMEPSEVAFYHLFSAASDTTQSIKHLVKAVPIIGMILSVGVFDFATYYTFKYLETEKTKAWSESFYFEDDSVEDAVPIDTDLRVLRKEELVASEVEVEQEKIANAELKYVQEALVEVLDPNFQEDAIPLSVGKDSLEQQAEILHMHDQSAMGNIDLEDWTPEQGCFNTSEVTRLAITISSNLNLDSDQRSFSEATPMKTLEAIIAGMFNSFEQTPYEIDFSSWNGAFDSTPEANKAKITVLSYLIQYHPEKVEQITEIKGVEREHLLMGAIHYANLPVFKWLHTGKRAEMTIEQTNVNLFQALLNKQKEGKPDPVIISTLDEMLQFYMRNFGDIETA